MLNKSRNPVTSCLLGVAALHAVVSFLGIFLYSPQFDWLDWLVTSSPVVYIVLGIVAKGAPRTCAAIGLLLFAAFLGYQAVFNPELIGVGWIFKTPIGILLVTSLVLALRTGSTVRAQAKFV